jgi:hypothetical protein
MTTPVAEGGVPPAAPITPPVPPPAAATTPAAVPQPVDESQPWFKERLARAEEQGAAKRLAELGIKDPAKAKADLDAAEKAREEAKSVAEKLTDTASKLTRTETELEHERAINKEWATRQMMALTPEQQEAVKAIAGENHAKQLQAITALAPTWAKQTTEPTATKPLQPPTPASGTAPPPSAPPGTVVSPANPKEVHAALLKTNPFAAADYGLAHQREVFPEPQQ